MCIVAVVNMTNGPPTPICQEEDLFLLTGGMLLIMIIHSVLPYVIKVSGHIVIVSYISGCSMKMTVTDFLDSLTDHK